MTLVHADPVRNTRSVTDRTLKNIVTENDSLNELCELAQQAEEPERATARGW